MTSTTWPKKMTTQVSEKMYRQLQRLAFNEGYDGIGGFIRDTVRRELVKRGYRKRK